MAKTVQLLINDYIGDDFDMSRQVRFIIEESCLIEYLAEWEFEERSLQEFLDTYDSDEAESVYNYADNDNRILSEEIIYCDDFLMEYKTAMEGCEDPMTKEDYYWEVYKNKYYAES